MKALQVLDQPWLPDSVFALALTLGCLVAMAAAGLGLGLVLTAIRNAFGA